MREREREREREKVGNREEEYKRILYNSVLTGVSFMSVKISSKY